jgi:hypothetical protein
MTIHNIASYSLSVTECQGCVKDLSGFTGKITVLDGCFLGSKARLGFGTMIIGATGKMVAVRVGIPLNGELLGTFPIVVGKPHVGATSNEECANNNNCSQFFSLSTEFTSSKASSGKVKDLPPTTAETAIYWVPD